ncbi:MAG: hypothetical protein HY894_02625 [Deltaproteobacteria bacterium]|nr:hypothetical protein [Deltaproteobacteria bacterium]
MFFHTTRSRVTSITALSVLLLLCMRTGASSGGIDWGRAASARVVLFYPGVASWEFLTSDDHRLGAKEIKRGRKECRYCHLGKDGELDLRADEIAAGRAEMKRSHNPLEPSPQPGKAGVIHARVCAAYDKDWLYVRVEWEGKGAGWNDKRAQGVADRVSLQINKSEPSFRKYGCFVACHNDLDTMPDAPSKKDLEADPYYGPRKRDDARLYAFYARESWSRRLSGAALDKRLREGGRIDLMSIEFLDARVAGRSGWVFDDRLWDDKTAVEATGAWAGGIYAAVFKRRLKTADARGVNISGGDVISTGLAIHDDGAVKRRHYVSFPFTIGIGAEGGITATRLKD